MGCGCPDGDPACSRAPKGLGRQIRCGARLFRRYLDELDARNRTISGWGKGIPKKSLEGTTIIPSNLSTAALYTYTPWVLIGQGKLAVLECFEKVFSSRLEKPPQSPVDRRPCSDESDCGFEGAKCVIEDITTGPRGMCTLECDSVCPDLSQPFTAQTVCSDRGQTDADGNPLGLCVSRCDDTLFPKRAVHLALTVSIAFDLRSQTEHSKHVLESTRQQNLSRHNSPFAFSSKTDRGLAKPR